MATVATTERSNLRPDGPQSSAPIGWSPERELDARDWASAGRRLGAVGRCIQWLIGDWIAYGNARFGERYARASKITGYDTQTLMNMVYVASRYSVSRRRENLSWSHHESLAAMELEEQDHWLDQACEHRWSVSDLRMMVRMSRREAEAPEDADSATPARAVRCPRCGEEVPLTGR